MKIRKPRTVYSMFTAILLSLGIFGCSSVQKAEYPPTANPSDEIHRLESDLEQAVGQQFDVVAPKPFAESQEHLERAKDIFARQGSMSRFWKNMAYARGYLNEAQRLYDKRAPKAPDVLAAREAALNAGARRYEESSRELKALDDSLKKQARLLDADKPDKDLFARFRTNYEVLEIITIQAAHLGEARELVRYAKRRGARAYAPRSLRDAESALADANEAIARSPNEVTAYLDEVQRAQRLARVLVAVNATARRASGQSNEEVAREIVARNRAIDNLQFELLGAEIESALNQRALAGQSARLQGLRASNESLASEQQWNAAIEEAREEFSEDEAEVYRQGDKLLIRLKKMNFPSGSAEVPERSKDLLSKVGSVIEELHARDVEIQGHTDSTGSADLNEQLSKERARAVAEVLEEEVGEVEMKAVGYGYQRPIAPNKSARERAINRRVDVVITPTRSPAGRERTPLSRDE